MSNIVGRMREAFRGEQRVDPEALIARLQAVQRFLAAVDGQVPDAQLVTAHTVVERAGTRLALSGQHTVVALAGATGSGKSSLFNALARLDLSPVGVRRPTTGSAYACVWGPLDGASRLLDWIGVLPRHRFVRRARSTATTSRPCTVWSCWTCRTSTRCSTATGWRWTGCSAWSTWSSGWSIRRSTPTG